MKYSNYILIFNYKFRFYGSALKLLWQITKSLRLFSGGESGAYKIKQVLFLIVLSLLAATKRLLKKTQENNILFRLSNILAVFLYFIKRFE